VSCDLCVDFLNDNENTLLQIIAEGGIGATCGDLCSKLGSGLTGFVCDAICMIAGLNEFAKLLSDSDIEPVYICSRLGACKLNRCMNTTGVCVEITSATVSPSSAPLRSNFDVTLRLQVIQVVGAGYTEIAVIPPGAVAPSSSGSSGSGSSGSGSSGSGSPSSSNGSPSSSSSSSSSSDGVEEGAQRQRRSSSGGGSSSSGSGSSSAFVLGVLTDGWSAGSTQTVVISIDTDEDDWKYPEGLYTVEAVTCGSACSDQHGVVWSTASTNFTITT